MNKNKIKEISKHLSYVLRHRPDAIGLDLDQQGWAQLDDLISKSSKKLTRETIQHIVDTNDKKRFILSDDGKRIRANQGHSIKIDLGTKSAVDPPAALISRNGNSVFRCYPQRGIEENEPPTCASFSRCRNGDQGRLAPRQACYPVCRHQSNGGRGI